MSETLTKLPEKTAEDREAQMVRISEKLYKQAREAKGRGVLDLTNTPGNTLEVEGGFAHTVEHTHGDTSTKLQERNGMAGTLKTKDQERTWTQAVTFEDEGIKGGVLADKENQSTNVKVNPKKAQEMAASHLGHLRGELAKREIAADTLSRVENS